MSLLGFIGRVLFVIAILILASPFLPLFFLCLMMKDIYDTDL